MAAGVALPNDTAGAATGRTLLNEHRERDINVQGLRSANGL